MAENAYRSQPRDLGSVRAISACARALASLYEYLGDYVAADQWSESALRHAGLLAESTPENQQAKLELRLARSRAVRARWRLNGEQADFRALASGPSQDQIDEDLANGLVLSSGLPVVTELAEDSFDYLTGIGDNNPKTRAAEAERAVELSRGLLQKSPIVARRVLLARSLLGLGQNLLARARIEQPAERDRDLQRGLASARESVELFSSLKREKALPQENLPDFNAALLNLANLEARIGKTKQLTLSTESPRN